MPASARADRRGASRATPSGSAEAGAALAEFLQPLLAPR